MNNTKNLALILSVLIMSSLAGYFAFASWQEPIAPPPGGNVPAPLNTSLDPQQKYGSLRLGGLRTDSHTWLATDSGHVGIGTENPADWIPLTIDGGGSGILFQVDKSDAGDIWVDNTRINIHAHEDRYLQLMTNNVERMRITSTGNVGIGTTNPVAWAPLTLNSDDGGAGVVFSDNDTPVADIWASTRLHLHAYGDRFIHFSTNNIERMRITSAGNVGIGTTNPVAWAPLTLNVEEGDGASLVFTRNDIPIADIWASTRLHLHAWGDRYIHFSTNNVERMRITSAGNVGIGTASPATWIPLTIDGDGSGILFRVAGNDRGDIWVDDTRINIHAHGDRYLQLMTNNVERMRITSAGNVGIGITSPTYRLELPNVANPSGQGRAQDWTTYSSIRYKDNIVGISGREATEKIMALNPVSFHWKEGGKEDIGFIAEEVGKVIPGAVEIDGEYADSLSTRQIIAYLTRVAQEQQEMIYALEQETKELKKEIFDLYSKQNND